MRIIRTLAMLIAPLFAMLGIDFTLSTLIRKGRVQLSKDSSEKYQEIESEYKQKLIAWAKKRGINTKKPNKREQELLKNEINIIEGEALDKFIDYLKANRRRKDIKALLVGTQFVKIIHEHIKNRL